MALRQLSTEGWLPKFYKFFRKAFYMPLCFFQLPVTFDKVAREGAIEPG